MLYLIQLLLVCNFFLVFYFLCFINFFFLVIDPRLKLQYYKDHHWESEFIDTALKDIESLYKSNYAPPTNIQSSIEDSSDSLLNHIYKRRRLNDNELDQYFEAPIISKEIDLLTWWKVYF